ncbi:hypothetical protein WA158_002399 [Blastocystis sp. Blastoise]
MKVFIQYKETTEDNNMKVKLTLNSKWSAGPVIDVKNMFLKAYNKKYPEEGLTAENTLFVVGSQKCFDDDIVEKVVEDYGTFKLEKGEAPKREIKKEENHEGMLQCKNYGCLKWYKPEENVEGCCIHHVGPPLFHDTKKGWTCCEKRVYDWDSFHKIEGCTKGKHNPISPDILTAPSPTIAALNKINQQEQQQQSSAEIKSISSFNTSNPNAPSAIKSLVNQTKPEPVPMKDGKCLCLNHGCGQWYDPNTNMNTSCHYHSGAPYFHDGAKSWTCCSKEVLDFNDFLNIAPCCVGYHYDGRGEDLNQKQ